MLRRIRDRAMRLQLACGVLQAGADRVTRFGIVRPGRAAQGLEEQAESRRTVSCGEPVPGDQQVRGRVKQLLLLVCEHPQGENRVEFRVVPTIAFELPVLVVLDEMVIRVARERQRVEPQRVYRRHLQQPQPGARGLQVGDVELDEIVAEQKSGAVGEVVEVGQRLLESAALLREHDRSAAVGSFAGERVDAASLCGDLKIY